MGVKNYYDILGVKENAKSEEIKRAYRRLAKEYHPDANQGDKQAENKFKEIAEAYDIIGNSDKRQKYDQMRKFGMGGMGGMRGGFDFSQFGGFGGAAGKRGGRGTRSGSGTQFDGFDIFSDLGSLFSQFFDQGEHFRQQRNGPQNTGDITVELPIPFELSVNGGKSTFTMEKDKSCPACQGGGAKPGSEVRTCPDCNGRGTVTIAQGGFGVSRPCPKCYGRGQMITNPCDQCKGTGEIRGKQKYAVKIPPGIESGQTIRLKGQGERRGAKGQTGNLLVKIRINPHRFFRRRGMDILCTIPLSLKQAATGTKVRVKTSGGKRVDLTVPAGTNDGTTFRLKDMGIRKNGKRGSQLVTVQVTIPDHPTTEEKEWLEALEAAEQTS